MSDEQLEQKVETPEEKIEEKTPQQIAQEEAQKKQEEQMEQIVITSREKILPILKKYNLSVEESGRMCDMVAVVLNQSIFRLMKSNTVGSLKLDELINKEYPNYEMALELIEAIKDDSIELGLESNQWTSEKIKATLKEENRLREFEDLSLDY